MTSSTTKNCRFEYTIPLTPVTKKNSQQILTNHKTGAPFISQSKRYKDYERAAIWFIKPLPKSPIKKPCNVKMLFYMPTRRRVDLPNLQNCILDVLVKAGALHDDNSDIVVSMDGSRVLYDRDNPRTEVEITEININE